MLWLTTGSSKSWKKKDYAKLSSYENNVLTYCLWTVSNQFLFTGVCTKQLKSNLYCTSLIYSGINIINEQVLKSLTGLFCFKMICLFSGLVDIFSFSKRALKWKVLNVQMQLWQPSVHVEPVSFQPLSACCVHFFSWCLYSWTLSAVPHVTCSIFVFNYWVLLNNKAHKVYESPELSGWCAGWLCYQLFQCQGDAHTQELSAWLPRPRILPGDGRMAHMPSAYPYFPCSMLRGYVFPVCFPCCFWCTLLWHVAGRQKYSSLLLVLEGLKNKQTKNKWCKTFLSFTGVECLPRGCLFCP